MVVGWAGLLDLGYIAFYGIGSYTTAYFTGSLPLKPPDWLHFTPLLAIPFAIVACLIAGVLLGAPTLRLRGDYLAIVTLGFGEIIQLIAINNPGNLTGGPIGPNVPHPVIKIGPIHVTWGLDNLPYWYLLLALLGIVVVLFYRLEGSRLGRAWAAIREDEVAAQATGIHTAQGQAARVRDRRLDLGPGRRLLRQPGRLLRPVPVHPAELDPHRRLRRLRRDGLAGRARSPAPRC